MLHATGWEKEERFHGPALKADDAMEAASCDICAGAPSSCCDSFWADWVWKMVEIHAKFGRNFGISQDWVIQTIGSLKDLQLWPFTSYKYLENPIYRIYNPIFNQL